MQETEIVYYPEIFIFTIDREHDGSKFDGIVNYPPILKLQAGVNYELYAVSNHSGDLDYGHYVCKLFYITFLNNNVRTKYSYI